MRIYTDKVELISEIKRDLVEMGFPIQTFSMQNKVIEGNRDYDTLEITNYNFCLSDLKNITDLMKYEEFLGAEMKKIKAYFKTKEQVSNYCEYLESIHVIQDWRHTYDVIMNILQFSVVDITTDNYKGMETQEIYETLLFILGERIEKDFNERIQIDINPGEAYKIRPRVRSEFLVQPVSMIDGINMLQGEDLTFDYTYSERLRLANIIDSVKLYPTSRQYVVPVFRTEDQEYFNGIKRIPCSLNYQILVRPNGEKNDEGHDIMNMHIIYNMRSCDFLTHFPIDIIQAYRILEYVYNNTKNSIPNLQIGKIYYNCASLHMYRKDMIENVF